MEAADIDVEVAVGGTIVEHVPGLEGRRMLAVVEDGGGEVENVPLRLSAVLAGKQVLAVTLPASPGSRCGRAGRRSGRRQARRAARRRRRVAECRGARHKRHGHLHSLRIAAELAGKAAGVVVAAKSSRERGSL